MGKGGGGGERLKNDKYCRRSPGNVSPLLFRLTFSRAKEFRIFLALLLGVILMDKMGKKNSVLLSPLDHFALVKTDMGALTPSPLLQIVPFS